MSARFRFIFLPGLLIAMGFLLIFTHEVRQASAAVGQPIAGENASAAIAEQSVQQDTQPPCDLSAAFPQDVRGWCGLIQQAAGQHGLDPRLVAAVITIESAGNPQAFSPQGAVGLMQIMPSDGIAATFQCLNGPCFGDRPSASELFDPAFNVEYGAGLLSSLITRHGSWREALAAYGPMDVGYSYADMVLEVYEKAQ